VSGPRSRVGRRTVLALAAAAALVAGVIGPVGSASAATGVDISTDPFTQATCRPSNTGNHQANVEPDSYSNGSTIVAAFQVGRIYDGGACAIGFATSTVNGTTWTNGLLPGITKWTAAPGANDRATDASVAYDASMALFVVAFAVTVLAAFALAVTSTRTGSSATTARPVRSGATATRSGTTTATATSCR